MMDCISFITMAMLQPTFVTLPRGSSRYESGHITQQPVSDTRTLIKHHDGFHYYLVESKHGPIPRFVEKVAQRGLLQEFCSIMDVQFQQGMGSVWSFQGLMSAEMGGAGVRGEVDLAKSYFHNHTWVEIQETLRLEVTPAPSIDWRELDLSQVIFCEEPLPGQGIACTEVPQDLQHLKD